MAGLANAAGGEQFVNGRRAPDASSSCSRTTLNSHGQTLLSQVLSCSKSCPSSPDNDHLFWRGCVGLGVGDHRESTELSATRTTVQRRHLACQRLHAVVEPEPVTSVSTAHLHLRMGSAVRTVLVLLGRETSTCDAVDARIDTKDDMIALVPV